MHPLIVSDLPIDRLHDAIGTATQAPFSRGAADEASIDLDVGETLLAGEVEGRSFLVDLSATMISSLWSLLSKIAMEFNCLVVTCSYDRIESQSEFFAAHRDQVLRLFWHNPKRTTRDYSIGDPLKTELGVPLSSPGGAGLTAALHSFDFHQMDYLKGFHRVPGDFIVTWAGDGLKLSKRDALCQQVDDHVREYANPDYNVPVPRVRIRSSDV